MIMASYDLAEKLFERTARELIYAYGVFAHMHALEIISSRKDEDSRQFWRDVLSVLDEITDERNENDNAELRTTETNQS